MLHSTVQLQTIEYMSIVSLCVCTSAGQFVSNYAISKSIRRVSPAVMVVTDRSVADMSQILKYIGYYMVTSAEGTHILAKKSDEVQVVSIASNKNSILTVDMLVAGFKFKVIAASAIHRELLVSNFKDSSGPTMLAGLFTGNPFNKSSQTLLASMNVTLVTRDDAEDDVSVKQQQAAKSRTVPAIAVKNMICHGTGMYTLGQRTPGPQHLWSRLGS